VLLISDVQPTNERDPSPGAFEIFHFRATSAEHQDVERALLAAGIFLPIRHRAAAIYAHGESGLFVAVRDSRRWIGGVFVQQRRLRVLPGYSLWRIDNLGDAMPANAREPVLRYVLDLVRQNRRVLRFNIGLFSRDSSVRSQLGSILDSLGFANAEANTYTRTIAVDLRSTEAELLSSFSSSVRKRLKEFARIKIPVSIQHITDASLAPRMNELMKQTMARTGGRFTPVDWERRIALANSNPDLCRVVGVVNSEIGGDEKLLAFVCGWHHGRHAQYSEGASARQLGRLPLMYPLLWDLIRWARDNGAQWFDMGGVTAGSFGDGQDALGGISDFKRRFSDDVIDVAEEWVLVPASLVATLATRLNRFFHAVRDFDLFAKRASPATSGAAVTS
jgi:Acetyltransferase (GNAT) domain